MTSKLTIEQAKRLRNDFECWQQDYDPKDDKEQYDMFGRGMAAMDMLIAGMYQEPVAYTDERNLGYIDRGRETAYLWGKQNSETGDVPLYRHAQQPVVPDAYVRDERGRMMLNGVCEPKIGFGAGWNACRAAMLNHPSSIQPNTDAAPGSEIKHPSSNSQVIGIDPASGPDRTVEVRYVAPPGYVMVPKEPTPEMLAVINEAIKSMCGSAATYARVLAAAPQGVPDGK